MLRWLDRIAGPSVTVRVGPARSPLMRPERKASVTSPTATSIAGEISSSSTKAELEPNPDRNISTAEIAATVPAVRARSSRSEEHTSELQSRGHLVCRLLLEKKKHKR